MARRRDRTIKIEQQIVGLSSKMSQRAIAEKVGVGQWTVWDVQRKYHIVQRFSRHLSAKHRYAYNEHTWGRILEHLYLTEGFSMEEIAEQLGIDRLTVKRRMEHLGIPIRALSEAHKGRKRKRYRSSLPRCDKGCGHGVKPPHTTCSQCRPRAR